MVLVERALGGGTKPFDRPCICQGRVNGNVADVCRHAAVFYVLSHAWVLFVNETLVAIPSDEP